jgi:DNA-directed RNA polymerase subunit RPC12/RpoP
MLRKIEDNDTKTVYYRCEECGFESDPKPRHQDSGPPPHPVCKKEVKVHIV